MAFGLHTVPFGRRQSDGILVDAGSVPAGAQCGCECPACAAPLVARHGAVRDWHFAHASRGVHARTRARCEFSFWVSLRMMARQLLTGSVTLGLPAWRDRVDDPASGLSVPFVVTEERAVEVEGLVADCRFETTPVDALGFVRGTPLAIYLVHPERSVPDTLKRPGDPRAGVVRIDLTPAERMFGEVESGAYKEALHDFLRNDLASKRFVYHPRYGPARAKAVVELERRIGERRRMAPLARATARTVRGDRNRAAFVTNAFPETDAATAQQGSPVSCECVVCKVTWTAPSSFGLIVCPKCRSHLYIRRPSP